MNYRGYRIDQLPSGAWSCKVEGFTVTAVSTDFIKALIDAKEARK